MSFLFVLFSFHSSPVWSIIPEDDDDRIINFPNNDPTLLGETNITYPSEKNFQSHNEKKHNIIAKPSEITIPDFNFSAVGDWGCSIDAKNTLRNIIDKEPDLVLVLGDLSYQETEDCWLKIIKPIDKITKIAFGNHDVTPALGTKLIP